jgi:hypothetical protein
VWARHAEGGGVGHGGVLMDRGQGGAVAGHLGMASSGTVVSTESGQGGKDSQWAAAGPSKASPWRASFKVEAGFNPSPYMYKKTFFNSNFFIICKPIQIQTLNDFYSQIKIWEHFITQ